MEGDENLFLLEVMVNSVHYFNSVMDIDRDLLACLGQTCVNVKFMQFPPMTICEENFMELNQPFEDTDVILKAGKSILFPWKRSARGPSCADIKIVVSRKRGGPYSTDYVIGKTSVPLSQSVTNLLAIPPQCGPGVKCVSGTYDIKNRCCMTVGNISIFLRLSSFGNLIVTKFLLKDADRDSMMYRGGSDIFKTIEDTLPCQMEQPAKLDCAAVELEPLPFPPIPDNFSPSRPTTTPCPPPCPRPSTPCPPPQKQQPSAPPPQPYPFCQRITIGEPPSTSSSECSEPPQPQLPFNLCDCDYPTPPGLSCPPCPPKKKKKKKREACCPLEPQPGDYCLRSDCPCGLQQPPWLAQTAAPVNPAPHSEKLNLEPGALAFRGKQAVLPFAEHHGPPPTDVRNFNEAAQVKMGVADGERGQRNVVSVTPDVRDMVPDPIPDKDVFVLHVGKPSPSSKAKMEITLHSPKFRDNRPQMADCETQYLEEDVGEIAKGGKKGKGEKGGKGDKKEGKGKKGKK